MQAEITFDWRPIAQLYNQSLLKKLATDANLESIRLVATYSPLKDCFQGLTVGELLDGLYHFLQLHYRSEYVYKNTIAQKIAIERHPTNNAKLLTEFRVNQSKADAVVLNGTSSVYEIKTEFDDLNRLEGQLSDYQKVFDKIYVVTHADGIDKVIQHVKPQIGVIALTDRFTLRTCRPALSNVANVDPSIIFDSLRQGEYLDILLRSFGFVPNGSKYGWYEQCKEQFSKLSPTEAHQEMLLVLKARSKSGEFRDFIQRLPRSLVAIGLASEVSKCQKIRILDRLSHPI